VFFFFFLCPNLFNPRFPTYNPGNNVAYCFPLTMDIDGDMHNPMSDDLLDLTTFDDMTPDQPDKPISALQFTANELLSMPARSDSNSQRTFSSEPKAPMPSVNLYVYVGNISYNQAKDEIVPHLTKNFKSSKAIVEIHPFCNMVYSKIEPAPSKAELDALQRVFPDAIVIISPQEILNQLCSVSFGLQNHVIRSDVLSALQILVDELSIVPPVGISVANNRASKSKFGTIFFLGPTALFTFVNRVPSFFIVQLYGWKSKSKIEIGETMEALGVEPGRYAMKLIKGQYVDFVIANVPKEKLPMFIHDVEINLPGITMHLVTAESNLLEKRVTDQVQQQGVDPSHQFSKLTAAQIETNRELMILQGKTRKLFNVVKTLQQELKTLLGSKKQLELQLAVQHQQDEQSQNEDSQKQGVKRTRSSSTSAEKSNKKKG